MGFFVLLASHRTSRVYKDSRMTNDLSGQGMMCGITLVVASSLFNHLALTQLPILWSMSSSLFSL